MHVEYTMHKSNNFSFTNMVYYRMYKKSRPFGIKLILLPKGKCLPIIQISDLSINRL